LKFTFAILFAPLFIFLHQYYNLSLFIVQLKL